MFIIIQKKKKKKYKKKIATDACLIDGNSNPHLPSVFPFPLSSSSFRFLSLFSPYHSPNICLSYLTRQ